MRAPLIGLTLRPLTVNGGPQMFTRNRAYFSALEDAGAVVLPLPVTPHMAHLRALYDRCDGLCMPGGPDVEPAMYGETVRADCRVDVATELDDLERPLLEWALADGKPVLAICRGMQLLNVLLGGTLWQDLETQVPNVVAHQHEVSHRDLMHEVNVDPASKLHQLVHAQRLQVNSRHHQAVRDVADSLQVSARADDGVIEAIEDPDRAFLVALQCHPEDMYPRFDWARALFGGFVSSAGG